MIVNRWSVCFNITFIIYIHIINVFLQHSEIAQNSTNTILEGQQIESDRNSVSVSVTAPKLT